MKRKVTFSNNEDNEGEFNSKRASEISKCFEPVSYDHTQELVRNALAGIEVNQDE